MWKSNLIVALRVLWRNKLISVINIVGLSAAMAVAVLCLLFVRHETSFDTWHERGDRIHLVYAERNDPQPGAPFNRFTMLNEKLREAIKTTIPGIRRSVYLHSGWGEISAGDEVFKESVLAADTTFFRTFTVPTAAGHGPTALDDPNSIVLSLETANKLFGSDVTPGQAVGRHVKLHFTERDFRTSPPTVTHIESERVVTAVLGPLPGPSILHLKTLVPAAAAEGMGFRGVHGTFIELAGGVSPEEVQSLLAPLADEHLKTSSLGLLSLEGAHFGETIVSPVGAGKGTIEHSYLLAGLALLILLVASINFVNLAMGRAATRTREIGVRKAVGAARHQLSTQFLSEAVLISLVAIGVGLTLAQVLLPTFNEITHQKLTLELLSAETLVGASALALMVGGLSGLYPALVTSRLHPVHALAGRGAGGGRSLVGRGLLILQFALSTFLVIVTLALEHQLNFMTTKDLGFDGDRVAMAFGNASLTASQIERLQTEITTRPGLVQGVAGANPAPGFGGMDPYPMPFGEDTLMVKAFVASASYLEVMGTQVVAGRGFDVGDEAASRYGILLNETAARVFGKDGPIGRTVVLNNAEEAMTVIGVVEDFHFQNLKQKVGPAFLTTRMPGWSGEPQFFHILFRLDQSDLPGAVEELKEMWARVLPEFDPPDVRFLDEALARQYETERRVGIVMRWMSSIAIVIACMGLFGLAALAATRRTREVGIRKALGASMGNVLTLISREFAWLVIVANAIAWPVAWYATLSWLESYAYRIEVGIGHFLTAGTAVLVVALATVGGQTWRAARVNPVEALRSE